MATKVKRKGVLGSKRTKYTVDRAEKVSPGYVVRE